MPYNYNWAVEEPEAGLNYGQEENSDGSVVTGEYRVLLPDGRTQIVRSEKILNLLTLNSQPMIIWVLFTCGYSDNLSSNSWFLKYKIKVC